MQSFATPDRALSSTSTSAHQLYGISPSAISPSAQVRHQLTSERKTSADVSFGRERLGRAPSREQLDLGWRVFDLLSRFWTSYPSTRFRDYQNPERDVYPFFAIHVVECSERRREVNKCGSAEEWATLVFASAAVVAVKRLKGRSRAKPMAHFVWALDGATRGELKEGATSNLDELRHHLARSYGLELEKIFEPSPEDESPAATPDSTTALCPSLEDELFRRAWCQFKYERLSADARTNLDVEAEAMARAALGPERSLLRLGMQRIDERNALLLAQFPMGECRPEAGSHGRDVQRDLQSQRSNDPRGAR